MHLFNQLGQHNFSHFVNIIILFDRSHFNIFANQLVFSYLAKFDIQFLAYLYLFSRRILYFQFVVRTLDLSKAYGISGNSQHHYAVFLTHFQTTAGDLSDAVDYERFSERKVKAGSL